MRGALRSSLLVGALALGACDSTGSAGTGAAASKSGSVLKHVVMPLNASPDLTGHPVVQAFEQVFCSELFAMNDKQVVCPDDVRTLITIEQQKAALGSGEPLPMERIEEMTRAPRRVGLGVTQAGQKLRVEAVLQDEAGVTLVRDVVELGYNGEDVSERAHQLAKRVLAH